MLETSTKLDTWIFYIITKAEKGWREKERETAAWEEKFSFAYFVLSRFRRPSGSVSTK